MTIMWGGAAATVLLIAIWVASGWWSVGWTSRNGVFFGAGVGLIACGISFRSPTPIDRIGFSTFEHSQYTLFWWDPLFGNPDPQVAVTLIPLWIPTLCVFTVTTIAWRLNFLARQRERIARLNLCPACGYCRAGIAGDAKCPECGETHLST